MVARRKKQARPRRRKQAINLITAAETLVQGSILTRWAFGTDLIPFMFEGWLLPKTAGRPGAAYHAGGLAGGGSGSSWNLSLAEIIQSLVPGGQLGMSESYSEAGGAAAIIMKNLRVNAPRAIASTVITNIGFRVLKKVSSKQRSAINRNVLKPLGLAKDVKV
jgi:hypothetical protein